MIPLHGHRMGAQLKKDDQEDKHDRQSVRTVLEVDVDFSSDHNFYRGLSENIGAGGIFISTYAPASFGKRMILRFRLPDAPTLITVECEVRWHRTENPETPDMAPGMGLRFTKVLPDDLARIEEFVAAREPMFFDDE